MTLPQTKWRVFAFDLTTGEPVTGDAANITAKLSIDYGTATALADTNPTEVEDGYYRFDLSESERDGSHFELFPESSTNDVQVIGVPGYLADTLESIESTLAGIEAKTRLITEQSVNIVGRLSDGIFTADASTFVRDSGPLVITTIDDFSATSVEVVVSEFRNLKLRPILTVLNANLTKTSSSVSLPSALVITKTPTEPYSQRQLEYSIRETTSKNARQKGNIHVIDSARNYS